MLFLNSNFKIFEPFQYFFKGINFFLEFIIAISICYAVPSKLSKAVQHRCRTGGLCLPCTADLYGGKLRIRCTDSLSADLYRPWQCQMQPFPCTAAKDYSAYPADIHFAFVHRRQNLGCFPCRACGRYNCGKLHSSAVPSRIQKSYGIFKGIVFTIFRTENYAFTILNHPVQYINAKPKYKANEKGRNQHIAGYGLFQELSFYI